MPNQPTVASLFAEAAARLRADFEYIRASNPHSAEKGEEAETILQQFLNQHLPQRFHAGAGIVIDPDNTLSRQQDVIVYDSLSSPLYRYGPKTQIVPIDSVASVIEVKSTLTREELRDAYEKIASCKRLKKRRLNNADRDAGRPGTFPGLIGIVFAFGSEITLETIGKHAAEFNQSYASDLWPDMIVVLDRGVLSYMIQYPGVRKLAGSLMHVTWPLDAEYMPPAWFVHLAIHRDREYALNRFFLSLLSVLNFFPYRSGVPPFDKMLEGAPKDVLTVRGYQFDTTKVLRPAPEEQVITESHNPVVDLVMKIHSNGQDVAELHFLPWQDGSVIRAYGAKASVDQLFAILIGSLPKGTRVVTDPGHPGVFLTTITTVTAEEFRNKWPGLLEKFNLQVRIQSSADDKSI